MSRAFNDPNLNCPLHRRATGLVRTLVVASSTLAILLVCYSMYEYSQRGGEARIKASKALHPARPAPPEAWKAAANAPTTQRKPGSSIGQMAVGEGRDIRLSLYPREGTRSVMEIEVRRYEPTGTGANEFMLFDPLIRMRTKDSRAVRITADRGVLNAERKSTGNLDPRRGHLSGNVLIEIDRLTEDERAALPEETRHKRDPSQLVTVELDLIEFDLEYSKIVVPRGGIHVTASDLDFTANDLEVWFDDEKGRIEYLRINDGGRLVLRDGGGQFGMGFSGGGSQGQDSVTIVQWLRNAITASLKTKELMTAVRAPVEDEKAAEKLETEPVPQSAEPTESVEQGIPVFALNAKGEDEDDKPADRYFVRIEEDVEVTQSLDGKMSTRLAADVLEILREVSAADKQRARSASEGTAGKPGGSAIAVREQTTLEWKTRLTLQTCKPDDPICTGNQGTTIIATGSPTRLVSPQWQVTCSHLRAQPDESKVWFEGNAVEPVVVRSASAGVTEGFEVYTERTGNDLHIKVKGPGSIRRSSDANGEEGAVVPALVTTGKGDRDRDGEGNDGIIEFSEGVELFGRFVEKTSLSFTQGVVTKENRVLDRAIFTGDVKMREDELQLDADSLVVHFGVEQRWRGDRQMIERLEGRGHVQLLRLEDRITCSEIDVTLSTDRDGRTIPLVATARGNVEATQSRRTIQARDRLVVDFEMVSRPAPPFNVRKVHAAAIEKGLDPSTVDFDAKRREHEAKQITEVGVKRLRADGEVVVVDPDQSLEITAERLDCRIVNGQNIAEAIVDGSDAGPASVRLDTFSVTGHRIILNVEDQWAEVPGQGHMTFQSLRDLDGSESDEPIPISITWRDWMKYQGRENRSVFNGDVHATSQATTTFDCDRLVVEFEDALSDRVGQSDSTDWWIFNDLVTGAGLGNRSAGAGRRSTSSGFNKKPAKILATGFASVETAELDPVSGKLLNRARLTGPSLSVDLRPNVSRMLIEGAGKLLLEDFRPLVRKVAQGNNQEEQGLFSLDSNAGPSKTLIEWEDAMWYDFAIAQTRFEGNVKLKHLSGAELEKVFGRVAGGSASAEAGRSTFLRCNVLTVDFLDRSERARRDGTQRMGGLSSDRLRQFQASGAVELQDKTEGLSVRADTVVFEKARQLLQVYGTPTRKAHIVHQKPGQSPNVFTTERLFYDLKSKRFDIYKPMFTRGQ